MNLLKQTRILVVDDREDHGRAIAAALWRCGLPVLFVLYDEKTLLEANRPTHTGVRVVFMDINLSGGNLGDSGTAFAQVQTAVGNLLAADNGPWALVTWSSHDDQAEALFAHLRQRLPESLRPVSLGRLNKERLMDSDLADATLTELEHEITNRLGEIGPLVCLLGWEGHVHEAASSVIHLLGKTAEALATGASNATLAGSLICLLKELAAAEGGQVAAGATDVAPYLYRVLSALLADRLDSTIPSAQCEGLGACNQSPNVPQHWRRTINSMLHLDVMVGPDPAPGAIYVPAHPWSVPGPLTESDPQSHGDGFIAQHFLNIHDSLDGTELVSDCRLVFLDVTPPCDHVNEKAPWRRHVLACRIPVDRLHLVCGKGTPLKPGKSCNPKADSLLLTPEMADTDGGFVLLINANLWVTLPKQRVVAALGSPVARLRDHLMADVIGWLGRHVTRRGHVALRAP